MISIAMATYNGEKFLSEQLDSIIVQTVTDWELVVCDDCSTDATWAILQDAAKSENRIKIFHNDKNLGFKRNFEKAITLCSGEYIALSDQDDVWLPNHLEILLKNIVGHSMAAGNTNIINKMGRIVQGDSYTKRFGYMADGNDTDRLFFILFNRSPCQGASSLYTRDLLEKALPIPDGIKFHDAWFSACSCCQNGIGFTFKPITNYRLHGTNASGQHTDIKFLNRIQRFFEKKTYDSDRLIYCDELLLRFPNCSSSMTNIIEKAISWNKNEKTHTRWKNIPCLIKNYKRIYATHSSVLLPIRIVLMLLKGWQ